MKPVLSDKTVLRIQNITGQPISRGIDKAINSILDRLEHCTCCDIDDVVVAGEKS